MRIVAVAVGLLVALAGCGGAGPSDSDGRLLVVAGFAPLAEVAERVGGDAVEVRNLTPAGAEPHDLELGTDAVDAVEDADLVVFVGGGFQPALEAAAGRASETLDALPDSTGGDPHYWLDPQLLSLTASGVHSILTDLRPDAADDLDANLAAYLAELEALDDEMGAGLARCERRTIVTTHAAFGHLVDRYDLEQRSIAGAAPESEPDPATLARLADEVEAAGVTTIFTEPLVAPDVAETLAREAGVGTAVLDPIESLDDGATYASVMRRNLAALRTALGCT